MSKDLDKFPLQKYSSFIADVSETYKKLISDNHYDANHVHHLLNGGASSALHNLVSKSTRSKYGIFFSGTRLATFAASLIQDTLRQGATLADPACGAGDLMLAGLSTLPHKGNLETTLSEWGERIVGLDIHSEMVTATQHRIGLLAASKIYHSEVALHAAFHQVTNYFPNIRSGDYFSQADLIARADCILMNPPFTETDSPENCVWSTGKVQQAAVFMASIVEAAKIGQEIVAILPDVLRSGTRYERWRELINDLCQIQNMNIFGRFDPHTDVDVFVLHLKKRTDTNNIVPHNWQNATYAHRVNAQKLSDLCKVSVGAVVPHRHKNKGHWVPYIEVSCVPANTEITTFKKRRFTGSLHTGPFVVIRRTSSPSDNQRAIPSIINSTAAVAVENHFIVLQPHDNSLATCQRIVSILNKSYVNEWLNTTIRCRHLTTKVINEIPLRE